MKKIVIGAVVVIGVVAAVRSIGKAIEGALSEGVKAAVNHAADPKAHRSAKKQESTDADVKTETNTQGE